MNAAFYIDISDTRPPLLVRLKTATGDLLDLTTVATVTFRFRPASGSVFTRTGAISGDPTLGLVEYDWQISDFVGTPDFIAGKYDMKVHLVFGDGGKLTIPTLDSAILYVSDSLSV